MRDIGTKDVRSKSQPLANMSIRVLTVAHKLASTQTMEMMEMQGKSRRCDSRTVTGFSRSGPEIAADRAVMASSVR